MNGNPAKAEKWRNVGARLDEIRREIENDLGRDTELRHLRIYLPLLDIAHVCKEVAARVEVGAEN